MSPANPAMSIIIPAFNEENYLPRYLPTVLASAAHWEQIGGGPTEVIVVDNASTDDTAMVAGELGARVVFEPVRNIGQARNTGAAAARGRLLFFVDADTALPPEAISAAAEAMEHGDHVGGAVPPVYRCRRLSARALCRFWDWYRARHGGAQGVAQFCTAVAFVQAGRYRTDLYMSEDVEFFARLRALGESTGRPAVLLNELRVEPSTRRYDQWPTWRMLWWQNPVTARMNLSSRRFWRHWYDSTVR